MPRAVVLSAVRTPVGRYAGALAGERPDDLAALVIKEAVERAGVDAAEIEDVYFGAANQAGEAAKFEFLVDLRTGGESKQMRATQYLFQKDGAGYVLSFSTLPSLATKYDPTFTKSAKSFRFS